MPSMCIRKSAVSHYRSYNKLNTNQMNTKHLLMTLLLATALPASAQEPRYVGGDISLLPTYEEHGANYMDKDGKKITDMLSFLKEQGMNAMRVRLFVDPSKASAAHQGQGVRQDLDYVKKLGKRIKDSGLRFMLDFHYSDTWADPGNQTIPEAWNVYSWYPSQTVGTYTEECLKELVAAGATPDFIQTGNEISFGMLWGFVLNGKFEDWDELGGHLEATSDWKAYTDKHWDNFSQMLKAAGDACRKVCPEAKIIIHTEQVANTPLVTDFYQRLAQYGVDYDIIGTSYYPYYHGNLQQLDKTLTAFESQLPDKKIMVVETGCGYHWKMGDNDTGYPLSYEGQRKFTADLIAKLKQHQNVNGLFWWFLEANEYGLDWNTQRVTDGWYNASLFDNETGKALPALYELKNFSEGGTGLYSISISGPASDDWYTLGGVRSLNPSQSGFYIHNGLKVAIK